MTKNQLQVFCILLISAFVLLYAAVTAQHTATKSESNEEEVSEIIDKVDTLKSDLQELEGKYERLEYELNDFER